MVLGKFPVYRGVLLIWISVGQGPTALAVGAGEGCLDIFFLSSVIALFFLPLSGYRLKYCLQGPLSPKQATNQPNANSSSWPLHSSLFSVHRRVA